MQTSRIFGCTMVMSMAALVGLSSHTFAADTGDEPSSADRTILEQAGNAMVFQMVFADMAMASHDEGVLALAQYIYALSHRGLKSIEGMARDCGFGIDARLDAKAWRRVSAMREVKTPVVRDQVYLDAQLMRLYEARQENLSATVHAQHDIVKAFALRSEPEIENLILDVRNVAQRMPTWNHW